MKNLRKSELRYYINVDRQDVEFYDEMGHVVAVHSSVPFNTGEAARLEEFWKTWVMRAKFLACPGPDAKVTA